MNENEIERIAAAANALRPDWPLASLRTLLTTKLATRARRDVAVALAWVACESETKTPARVLEPGPWWTAVATEDHGGRTTPRPPRKDECCRICGRYLDGCLCDRPTTRPTQRSERTSEHVAGLRARLRPTTQEADDE